ncbi:MAG: hypothetical protein ABIO16_15550 [Nocardioides sp.]
MSARVPTPVTMPRRWVRVRGTYVAPGVHGSGLAPRLEHHAEPFDEDLDTWHRLTADADRGRSGFDLEDEDLFELGGHEVVYRRFGHAVAAVPVLTDQWLWVVDGVAHQLLGTVAVDEYVDYCDVFESVAETFDPAA